MFDEKKAERAVKFINNLKHTKVYGMEFLSTFYLGKIKSYEIYLEL